MNYKKLGKILGKIMIMEAALMLAPFIITFIYQESFINKLAFFTIFSAFTFQLLTTYL